MKGRRLGPYEFFEWIPKKVYVVQLNQDWY